MFKIGFDNEKYLQMQSDKIRERIGQFGGKLYLEFGGKLFDDYHASRVLPGCVRSPPRADRAGAFLFYPQAGDADLYGRLTYPVSRTAVGEGLPGGSAPASGSARAGAHAVRRMGRRRTSGIAERCRWADGVVRKGRDRMCGMPFVCNVRSGTGRRSRAGTGRSSVKIRYRNVKMYISPMTENG